MVSIGAFKQDVLRLYNEVNKKIFQTGVRQQRVDVIGNKILIVSINTRLPVLQLTDRLEPGASAVVDRVLQRQFKEEFRALLEAKYHMKVIAVLKDYDVKTEHAGTIVIFEQDVMMYLNNESEL